MKLHDAHAPHRSSSGTPPPGGNVRPLNGAIMSADGGSAKKNVKDESCESYATNGRQDWLLRSKKSVNAGTARSS